MLITVLVLYAVGLALVLLFFQGASRLNREDRRQGRPRPMRPRQRTFEQLELPIADTRFGNPR